MPENKIKVITEDKYQAFIKNADGGLMAETHIASLNINGHSTEFFIKLFKTSERFGISNEITGYLLAQASGIPVPEFACLVSIPDRVMHDLNLDPKDYNDGVAFGVSKVNGTTPATYWNLNLIPECTSLMTIIASWDKVNDLICFDDWVANLDRNIGNIVVNGHNDISIIDHSNMPYDLCWNKSQLNHKEHLLDRNKILQAIKYFKNYNSGIPLPDSVSICKANDKHFASLLSVERELDFWWSYFLPKDHVDSLRSFFIDRANHGADRLRSNLGLLIGV